MKTALFAFFLGMWVPAVAAGQGGGNETGNGGAGVVCADATGLIQSVELLDFYEAAMLADLTPSLGEGTTPLDKVSWALERLSRLDPRRAELYRKKADGFFGNARFIDQVILPDTKDYGHVPLKKGCRIEQVATQREPLFPGYKRYLISRDLWSRLPVDHKAGLILHEIVYGHALTLGHTDSINSRYFTALVASAGPSAMAQSEYDELVKRLTLVDSGQPGSPHWIGPKVDLGVQREDTPFRLDLRTKLSGTVPGLVFNASGLPAWMALSPDGFLFGTPQRKDIGPYSGIRLSVRLPSGESGSLAEAFGMVIKAVIPPVWKTNPLTLAEASEDVPYAQDLRPQVFSAEGTVLKFQIIAGPKWADVTQDGLLRGTPRKSDIGTKLLVIEVSTVIDGIDFTTSAEGHLTVRPTVKP